MFSESENKSPPPPKAPTGKGFLENGDIDFSYHPDASVSNMSCSPSPIESNYYNQGPWDLKHPPHPYSDPAAHPELYFGRLPKKDQCHVHKKSTGVAPRVNFMNTNNIAERASKEGQAEARMEFRAGHDDSELISRNIGVGTGFRWPISEDRKANNEDWEKWRSGKLRKKPLTMDEIETAKLKKYMDQVVFQLDTNTTVTPMSWLQQERDYHAKKNKEAANVGNTKGENHGVAEENNTSTLIEARREADSQKPALAICGNPRKRKSRSRGNDNGDEADKPNKRSCLKPGKEKRKYQWKNGPRRARGVAAAEKAALKAAKVTEEKVKRDAEEDAKAVEEGGETWGRLMRKKREEREDREAKRATKGRGQL